MNAWSHILLIWIILGVLKIWKLREKKGVKNHIWNIKILHGCFGNTY